MARINVHAGHNPKGKIACGASDLLDESYVARKVASYTRKYLKSYGHTVYNTTCNNGTSQSDVLKKICAKCNAHTVDLDVSIHLNSGVSDRKGNGKSAGCETWATANSGIKKTVSNNVRKELKALGFTDRGAKTTSNLYYLNHTKAKAILIEVCFVDDREDYNLVKKLGYKKIGQAIAKGINAAL